MSSSRAMRLVIEATVATAVIATVAVGGQQLDTASLISSSLPEQIVFAPSDDNVLNSGVLFTPAGQTAKPIAIIWIHGWGANFYQPQYVLIGRALARRGVLTIVANTRMHDIANVQQYRDGRRIRGGGYWGIPSEQVKDIAGWISVLEKQGFNRVVLVGHSAGWAAVRAYQAERQDSRVVGLVLASGQIQPPQPDQQLLKQAEEARQFIKDGRGDDLLRIPNRSFPSFISAATFDDDFGTPAELVDFFGVRAATPAITRVSCPITRRRCSGSRWVPMVSPRCCCRFRSDAGPIDAAVSR